MHMICLYPPLHALAGFWDVISVDMGLGTQPSFWSAYQDSRALRCIESTIELLIALLVIILTLLKVSVVHYDTANPTSFLSHRLRQRNVNYNALRAGISCHQRLMCFAPATHCWAGCRGGPEERHLKIMR